MDLEVLPNGERKLVLRQSAFKTYLTCGREFNLSYIRNLEPAQRKFGTSDVGTFVHHGLKAWYTGKSPEAVMAEKVNEEIAANPLIAGDLAKAAELAAIMVQGYEEWLGEEALDHGLTVVMAEERIEAHIGTYHGIQIWVSGEIDLLMQDVLGRVWVIDHKTVDRFDEIPLLSIDFQGQTYDYLLRKNGHPMPAGFIHNRLRRVKRTGTAKPPFYAREEVHFNETQRITHELHLQGIAEEIATKIVGLEQTEHPVNFTHRNFRPLPTRDCSWRCPFKTVCPMSDYEPEGAEEMIKAMFKQKEKVS